MVRKSTDMVAHWRWSGGDTLLNELLIREGLARAQLQYNYSREMKNRFQAAEDQAKQEKRGIWSLEERPSQ